MAIDVFKQSLFLVYTLTAFWLKEKKIAFFYSSPL